MSKRGAESVILGLVFVASCGQPAAGPAHRAPVGIRSGASADEVLAGRVLGLDGKPMKLAHVHAGRQRVEVARDGSFELELDAPFTMVKMTGVDHAELDVGIVRSPGGAKLEARLGTYARA